MAEKKLFAVVLGFKAGDPSTVQLEDMIAKVAEAGGGPTFPPHFTLRGDLWLDPEEVPVLAQRLASGFKEWRAPLSAPTVGEAEGNWTRTSFQLTDVFPTHLFRDRLNALVNEPKKNTAGMMPHTSNGYNVKSANERLQQLKTAAENGAVYPSSVIVDSVQFWDIKGPDLEHVEAYDVDFYTVQLEKSLDQTVHFGNDHFEARAVPTKAGRAHEI